MIQASCPSCGSPIIFPHGAVRSLVCGACESTIVRDDIGLHDIGQRSRILRDLSPIQVGATGDLGNQKFTVIGGVRKGHARIRWNEWFIQLSDGSTGWLSEGNGQFFIFDRSIQLPKPIMLSPGQDISLANQKWTVTEVGESRILGTEGALPSLPSSRQPYADLKTTNGQFATYDGSTTPPTLWLGHTIELHRLKMEGLRPFVGWSDPSLVNFAGPEIQHVRSLTCPNCGTSIQQYARGLAQSLFCSHCSSPLSAPEAERGEARLLDTHPIPTSRMQLALGSKGKINDIPYQVIGAMVRSVTEDNQDWFWDEYVVWNPYRGALWLVCDSEGYWSKLKILDRVPEPKSGGLALHIEGDVRWFRHEQGGLARVVTCLGEFSWEVAAGDTAQTEEYRAGPALLSLEVSTVNGVSERVWSSGGPMSEEEVSSFGGVYKVRPLVSEQKAITLTQLVWVFAFVLFLCLVIFAKPVEDCPTPTPNPDGTPGTQTCTTSRSGSSSSGGWSSGK